MTPTEKIRLGRQYRVSSWFVNGMKELATTLAKAPAVSVDTIAADIGWESAARIMTIVSNHKTAEMAREKIIPSSGEVKLRLNNVYCQREVCSINEGKRRVCPLNHSRLSLSGSSRRPFRPIGSTFDPRDAVFTDEEDYFTQNDDDSEEFDIGGPLGQSSRRRHPLSGVGGSLSLASTLSGGSQSRGNCSIDWSLLKTQVTEASSRDVPADTIRKAFEEEIKSLH
ncbi:hypothetical protein CC2G_009705 [Coprinopsis cinerea AmutBmut pab1-1]|nr:hypothetical protein CC2G_009705 [Coprinopsis cinerea AmutBmut pab1-1]